MEGKWLGIVGGSRISIWTMPRGRRGCAGFVRQLGRYGDRETGRSSSMQDSELATSR